MKDKKVTLQDKNIVGLKSKFAYEDIKLMLPYGSVLFLMFQKNTGAVSMSSLIISDSFMDVAFSKSSDEFLSLIEYILPMVFQGNPMVNNFVFRVISTTGYVVDDDGESNKPYIFIYDILFSSSKNQYSKLVVDIVNVLDYLHVLDFIHEDDFSGFFNNNVFRSKYPNISRLFDEFVLSYSEKGDVNLAYNDLGYQIIKEREKWFPKY